MQWRITRKTIEQLLEKPYGQYVVTLFAITLFLHQLNIYVFNHVETQAEVLNKIEVKIAKPVSEFVTLKPKKSDLDFQCQCKELPFTQNETLCSDYASTRGNEQKVISVSFLNSQNVSKLQQIVENTYQYYPGYFLRIYHNLTEKQENYAHLCDLFCLNDHVDLCHTMKIGRYGDSSKFFYPLWKYAVMADPQVLEAHFRDPGNLMIKREADAVQDWKENSQATFHIMRDHPRHLLHILKSLFGIRKKVKETAEENAKMDKFFKDSYEKMMVLSKVMKNHDDLENLLLDVSLWPLAEEDSVIHDSFTCQIPHDSDIRAWPSQRPESGPNYVGTNGDQITLEESGPCPEPCRPQYHEDWILC